VDTRCQRLGHTVIPVPKFQIFPYFISGLKTGTEAELRHDTYIHNTNLCFAKHNIRIGRWTSVNFRTGDDEENVLRLSYGDPRYVWNRLQACCIRYIKCIQNTKNVFYITKVYLTRTHLG